MSTRAIIAIPKSDGYETAWCWSDGFPDMLGEILCTEFKTEKIVKELIQYHSFESLMTQKEFEEYFEWRKKNLNHIHIDGEKFITLSNGCILHMESQNGDVVAGTGENGFFHTIEEMLGEDLNYVYVFKNGYWYTYQ